MFKNPRVYSKATEQVMELLIEDGPDGMPRAFEILANEGMKLQRWACSRR